MHGEVGLSAMGDHGVYVTYRQVRTDIGCATIVSAYVVHSKAQLYLAHDTQGVRQYRWRDRDEGHESAETAERPRGLWVFSSSWAEPLELSRCRFSDSIGCAPRVVLLEW